MSDLYRSTIHARISKLPSLPPELEEGNEEDEASDSLGTLPISMGPPSTTARQRRSRVPNPALSPISASGFFDQATEVSVAASGLNFRVYYSPPKYADGTVLVCHHGAGWSALTFACFSKECKSGGQGECGILAFDCRGHGKTTSIGSSSANEDLAIDILTSDLVNLLATVFPDVDKAPSLLLIGHSLGGSVIVRACPLLQSLKYKITGVAVIDVVEEFTREALPMMHSLLDTRPEGFESSESAIEWHIRTNAIRNADSARVSVPGVINKNESGSGPAFVWRTPLRLTAPYWDSWFTGLSSKFLSSRTARLLVLAGAERLDKELMIGQMQGKFQLTVMAGVGHMVQEDDPSHLADIILEFWRRNEHVVLGVKKVGEL